PRSVIRRRSVSPSDSWRACAKWCGCCRASSTSPRTTSCRVAGPPRRPSSYARSAARGPSRLAGQRPPQPEPREVSPELPLEAALAAEGGCLADVIDVEALPEPAERGGGGRVGPEVDRLAAGGQHQVEQLGAEVPRGDEARPADPLPERTKRRTDPFGVAAGRVEDAVDDE